MSGTKPTWGFPPTITSCTIEPTGSIIYGCTQPHTVRTFPGYFPALSGVQRLLTQSRKQISVKWYSLSTLPTTTIHRSSVAIVTWEPLLDSRHPGNAQTSNTNKQQEQTCLRVLQSWPKSLWSLARALHSSSTLPKVSMRYMYESWHQ